MVKRIVLLALLWLLKYSPVWGTFLLFLLAPMYIIAPVVAGWLVFFIVRLVQED